MPVENKKGRREQKLSPVFIIYLPTGLPHTRDLTLVCQVTEVNPGHPELPHVGVRTAIVPVTVVQTNRTGVAWQLGQANVVTLGL